MQEKSRDWSGVEPTCRKILTLLENPTKSPILKGKSLPEIKQSILRRQADALCHMGHKNHLIKAIEILEKVSC